MKIFRKKAILLSIFLIGVTTSYSLETLKENISKYNQRNDNYIDLNGIEHIENEKYRVEDEKEVTIFLKTKNNDIYSVEIIYGNNVKSMEGLGSYGGNELFTVKIPKENTEYYFKLKDSKTVYFYGKNVELDEKNINKFNYKVFNSMTYLPEWSKGSVGYQIYIDSFRNGNVDNDPIFNEFGTDDFMEPKGELRSGTAKKDLVTANWNENSNFEFSVNEWTSNYESKNNWEENALNEVKNYTRYYGGDLQGIKDKLDYLKELGVEYIILSSPFYSLSNHKYDTVYFNHIDPFFGNIEQTGTNKGLVIKDKVHNKNGDKELNLLIYNPNSKENLLGENTEDIKSWVWTDSDLEFASLIKEAHKRDIRVVIEVAPDITSTKTINIFDEDVFLNRNEGTINLGNEKVKNYFINSMKKWILGPDLEVTNMSEDDGIDGIKYVYYNEKNKENLINITKELKNIKQNLLITGDFSLEVEKEINSGHYDSGTDYNIVNDLLKYTVNTNSNYKIDSLEFASKLNEMYNKYTKNRFNSTQIFVDSVDTDRIYSGIINNNRIFDRNNQSNQGYMDIRPDLYDGNVINKLKKIISIQMMLPSTPIIYYGDEKGMWGSDSPRNRKPMLWEDYTPYENETDDISKYKNNLAFLPKEVEIDEVKKVISYPVEINKNIENHYKKLLEIRKKYNHLFKNGDFRILEVYGEEKTKTRVDNEIEKYLQEEKRKAKIYQGKDKTIKKPNVDFITYEIYNKKQSIIVILNNSSDSYPLSLNVPKFFGFYKNELNKNEVYSISDKKINVIVRPNEVKVLYSDDDNIFDAFTK